MVWDNPATMPVQFHGEEVYACPRQTLHEQPREWSTLLFYYGMYKKGHLPDRGSISEQSASMIEAFRVIDDENEVCDRIIADNEKRKQARNARTKAQAGKGKPKR